MLKFSKHALERVMDMALDPAEVREAMLRPEAIEKSRKYPGYHNHVKGDFALAVAPDGTVVTVLWRRRPGEGRWSRDDVARSVRRGMSDSVGSSYTECEDRDHTHG